MPFTEPDREVLENAYAAIEESASLPQSSSASDTRARLHAALVRTSRNVSALLQNAAVNKLDAAELPAVAQVAVVEAAQVLTALRGLTNFGVLGPLGANPTADRLPAMVADRATSYEATEVEELGSPETNMLVDQFALPMMHYATVVPGALLPDDELVGRALDTIGAGAALAAAASTLRSSLASTTATSRTRSGLQVGRHQRWRPTRAADRRVRPQRDRHTGTGPCLRRVAR